MSTPKKKFPLYRTIALGLVSIAIIGGIVFTAFYRNNQEKSTASANTNNLPLDERCKLSPPQMKPGETCTFAITYSNGEGEATTNSILEINIGSMLIPDLATFKNQITKVDGLGVTSENEAITVTSVPGDSDVPWQYNYNYKPGSHSYFKNDTDDKDGNLPASIEGKITFSVKLNQNVFSTFIGNSTKLYLPYSGTGPVVNDNKLRNVTQQGVYAVLSADQLSPTEKVPGFLEVVLLAAGTTPTYTPSGNLTGTVGSSVAGTITFTGTPTLSGNATFTNGSSCSITGTVANNVFTPTTGNIPAGCPTGSKTNGTITVGSTTVTGIGSNFSEAATTGNCDDKFGKNCRLYFVGADNAALTWNSDFQTNTNWNKNQKYKDGVVKLVFDNIRTDTESAIANGSSCKFSLARYGETAQLKELTGTTTSGKAEVTLSVADQTVNYYTVVVTCTETGTNKVVKDYDRLVLIVGASGGGGGGGNVDL